MSLQVVINADDLGMSTGMNDAIFAALAAGHCTSTSLLATGPAAEDALGRARTAGIAVGVHLCLTAFEPLTRGLRHLLEPDGTFGERSLAIRRADGDAVLDEWAAQVDRVRAAGVLVDHLDSHQHVHHLPALAPLVPALCARLGIRRVRGMGALRHAGVGTRVGGLLQPLRAARYRRSLRAAGLLTTDGFASVAVFLEHARRVGGRRRGAWGAAAWRRWRTIELMAHPGNPHHAHYADELAALTAGALDELPFPVTRIGWGDVR